MIYHKIILGLGAFIGIYLFKKNNLLVLKGIFVGLILCGLATISKQAYISDSAFFIFGILVLGFTFFSVLNKKWLGLIIGGFAFASVFFDFLIYESADELKWLMSIPVLAFLLVLQKWRDYESELSILTLLSAFELSEFLYAVDSL